MLEDDHSNTSQLRKDIEDHFVVAEDHRPQHNARLKEMSLSSEQKSSQEGRRVPQHSSMQEVSREQLSMSAPEDPRDYDRQWGDINDSKESHPIRGRKVEENLLIEEYGVEEEAESEYQMGLEHQYYDEDAGRG